MDRWTNKVAIVTGASSGIGLAIAEQLVNNGLKVVGIARRIDKLTILADEWKSQSGKLIPLKCDLNIESEIIRSLEWIEKNLGVVEILVNNAAVSLPSSIVEGNIDDWRKSLNVNVLGPVILIKEVLNILKKKGLNSGVIININDICAWNILKSGRSCSTSYVASKAALRGLSDNLRLELAQLQSNVKVINIVPGLVDTEMSEQTLKLKPRLALKPEEIANTVLTVIQTPETVLIQDLLITPIRDVVVV